MMRRNTADSIHRWLNGGIIVLLILVAANLLSWRSVEPDLWGHIQYGEDWLHSGQMPRVATHTFSAPDHPWINHENLFELALALGHRLFGGFGLIILKCLAGLWLLWAMVRTSLRRDVPLLGAVASTVPVAWGLSEFWLTRPQLFSFLFFGMMLLCIERAFRRWSVFQVNRKWLWACIPILILWTNSHGGFAAGLCVFLALLGLRGVEAWWQLRCASRSVIIHFGCLAAAAIASVFVNPYGHQLPGWMLISLSQPRPEVSEWANILDGGRTAIPIVVLFALTIVSLILSRRRKDWVELTVLGLIAVQAPGHVRHLAFFSIAFGFWMPPHLISVRERLVAWRPTLGRYPEMSPAAARWLLTEFGVVALLLSVLLGNSFRRFGVDRSEYPVDAIDFMARENVHGRLIVTFDWAQYALAALAPATTVGFDGRYDTCYPQEVIDLSFDLYFGSDDSRRHRSPASGPIDPVRILSYRNPELVLLDRMVDREGIRLIDQLPEWTRLYSDGRAILWGRCREFDNPASSRFVPPERRVLSDEMPVGIAEWPGFPERTGRNAFSPTRAADTHSRFSARVAVQRRNHESPVHSDQGREVDTDVHLLSLHDQRESRAASNQKTVSHAGD